MKAILETDSGRSTDAAGRTAALGAIRGGTVRGPPLLTRPRLLPRSRRADRPQPRLSLEVGAEIARALDHFDVPEREKQEGLAAIVARKDELVNP
jgi:hypothetical protein